MSNEKIAFVSDKDFAFLESEFEHERRIHVSGIYVYRFFLTSSYIDVVKKSDTGVKLVQPFLTFTPKGTWLDKYKR